MAFSRKTWVDRLTEFPTRRILTDTQGNETTVTVARSEGTVSQEGDAFNAENMNGLEGRIEAEFSRLDENLNALQKSVLYSSQEVDTGKKWIDGKTIYRKVYTSSSTMHDGNNIIDANFTTSYVDSLLSVNGTAKIAEDSSVIPFGYMIHDGSRNHNLFVRVVLRSNGLDLWLANVSITKYLMILEYTKA